MLHGDAMVTHSRGRMPEMGTSEIRLWQAIDHATRHSTKVGKNDIFGGSEPGLVGAGHIPNESYGLQSSSEAP